jgi:hypothetical protein
MQKKIAMLLAALIVTSIVFTGTVAAADTSDVTTADSADATSSATPPPPDTSTATVTLDKPSDWAMDEVTEAIEAGLIPDEQQYSFTDSIAREQFCVLVMTLLTVKTGKTTDQLLKANNVEIKAGVFYDTTNTTILAANALGIVGGVGSGKFSPGGQITRQDAAAMLMRTAKILKMNTTPGNSVSFSDSDVIASYAKEAVAFVVATKDKKSGKSVMGGVSENTFDPLSSYTKEQAFITMRRLYNAG